MLNVICAREVTYAPILIWWDMWQACLPDLAPLYPTVGELPNTLDR